jgi:DNA-binding NtrC family response regulator
VYLLDYVDEIARMLILRFASNPNGVEQMVSERTEESMTTESDGRTILVIDDDRVLADTLSDILRKHGFKPVALYSGEEALELAGRFRPDVVLSDIRMSRLDGIEAAKRIRMLHPECRIILFTAHTVSTALTQLIHGLGFEFLQRPLHPERILTALSRLPDGHRA